MKPAFPVHPHINTADNAGMTLRDYFAAKAMQGLIQKWHIEKTFSIGDHESCAKMSYKFADAMLNARETTTDDI